MEIQEFAPRHLIARLVFEKKHAAVVDRRGELADELHELLDVSSVAIGEAATEATTDDGMSTYRIGIAQLVAVLNIDGLDEERERMEGFFRRGMELLGAPSLSRVVAHTSDVAAVPSFDELRDALLADFSPATSQLRDAVGIPLSDCGWNFDFEDDRSAVELVFGPMRERELRRAFEAPESADFPAASLFIDVEVTLRVRDSDNDPLDLWASALDRNRRITDNLSAWMRETLT
jgi:hypothetical protein